MVNKTKTQDHLGNHQANRKVTGKSVTTPWITELLEYFLQSSTRIQDENKVKRLIAFRTRDRRRRSTSKESQDLVADMNNTRKFFQTRWYGDEEYRKSLSATMLHDRVAMEKHVYIATRAERIQNSKHWILTANEDGRTQQSLNQRHDFAQAKRECKRLHDEHLARTHQEKRVLPRSQ